MFQMLICNIASLLAQGKHFQHIPALDAREWFSRDVEGRALTARPCRNEDRVDAKSREQENLLKRRGFERLFHIATTRPEFFGGKSIANLVC